MVDFILSLPSFWGALLFIVFTTAIGLGIYFLSAWFISKYFNENLERPVGDLFRIMGIMVSFFLSLTFADVVLEMKTIDSATQREAIFLADINKELCLYGVKETGEIRALLKEYTKSLIENDWPALEDDQVDEATGDLLYRLEYDVWHLEPTTKIQDNLKASILNDVDKISEFRLTRLQQAFSPPPFFVVVVLLGFVFSMMCYGVYKPQLITVLAAVIYTLFIGIIIYIILAYSDPFQGFPGVDTTPLQNALERIKDCN